MWWGHYLVLRVSYQQSFWGLSIHFDNINPTIASLRWTTLIPTSALPWAFQWSVHSRYFGNVCGTEERLRYRSLALSQLMSSVKNCNNTRHGNSHCAGSTLGKWDPVRPLWGGKVVCILKILHRCGLWWISRWKRKKQRLGQIKHILRNEN